MEHIAVIYENKNFLAVNKPAGLLVHPVKSKIKNQKSKGLEPTLVDWLLKRYPEVKSVGDDPDTRPGIVHRLDKDTSGVLLIAKNQAYFTYLKSLFQTQAIQKTYLALVRGKMEPREGSITKPIGIKKDTIKRTVYKSKRLIKEAITQYTVLKYMKGSDDETEYSLLEVVPKTGRTHQIRVHCASIGHPIVGDALYGGKSKIKNQKSKFTRLMLHALSLEFNTAEGKRIKIEAEPPPEFAKFL